MSKPAEAWPLAYFLQEELYARCWTWTELARRMDCDLRTVRRIRLGKRLTRYGAARLARVFETSSELWLRLDEQFWASLKRELDEKRQSQEVEK